MAAPRYDDWLPMPPVGTPPRRRRGPWIVIATVLVVGLAAVAAFAIGGQPKSAGSPSGAASPAPGVAQASSTPTASPSTVPLPSVAPTDGPTDSPGPTFPPIGSLPLSPGLIAAVDDNGALATVDGHGQSRVNYPAPGVTFGFPAWSPDGSRIALVGARANDGGIYVFTVPRAGGKATAPAVVYRSPDEQPFYLYWTPDSRHVSFLTNESAGIALRVADVTTGAPLDGSDTGSIIRRGAPLYFDWVNTDRALLHVGTGSNSFVGQVGLDGKVAGSALPGTGTFRTASLSRDRRYVAFGTSGTGTSGEVVVQQADGSHPQRLPVFGPAAMLFDPKSDALATLAADAQQATPFDVPVGPVRLIDPASGKVRTLVDGSCVAFFWSPDGKTIAVIRAVAPGQGPSALLRRPSIPGDPGPSRTTAGVGPFRAAADLTAAGTNVSLVFVDVATGKIRSEHVVGLGESFVQQLLPYFDQYSLSHTLWSPDSAAILLPLVTPQGRNQLAVIRADGTTPATVADGGMGSWSP